MITKDDIVAELEKAGLSAEDIAREYWLDCLVEFRNTGGCGSVNASTVEFIPLISQLLSKVARN